MAKEIAPQLQKKGHVTRGLPGVNIKNVTPKLAKLFGLKDGTGTLVAQVTSEGPAEKAGIRQGDVIREVNRKPVRDVGDFVQKIEQAKAAVVLLAQALPFFH
jgi:serine protease Do